MKAIDYFNKYKLSILEEEKLNELFKEMNKEIQDIASKRNAKKDSAMVAIIREMNQKWNKLCKIYEDEYGTKVLIRNGYIKYWEKHIPQLKVGD